MAKKIYMVCGMMITEEEFNRVCKDEGVSDFPKRRLKPKMHPCDEDEFEVDPGPWQHFSTWRCDACCRRTRREDNG